MELERSTHKQEMPVYSEYLLLPLTNKTGPVIENLTTGPLKADGGRFSAGVQALVAP